VLHEMLTLEHLFAGDSDLATIKKVLEIEIPRPSHRRQDLPPELDRIVMRALERDPARRYPSAAEMGRELDDFVLSFRLRLEDVVEFLTQLDALRARPMPVPPPTPQ
jgi:eukaryotic-like serine/threonine-protein kinase